MTRVPLEISRLCERIRTAWKYQQREILTRFERHPYYGRYTVMKLFPEPSMSIPDDLPPSIEIVKDDTARIEIIGWQSSDWHGTRYEVIAWFDMPDGTPVYCVLQEKP